MNNRFNPQSRRDGIIIKREICRTSKFCMHHS
jgi:hypothetical protein